MRLTFLGTRAHIDAHSERHRRHSATLIEHAGARVLLDCGADWRGHLGEIAPDAIVLTHAHPDHAFGLRDGAPCPVYATAETWAYIDAFPVDTRRRLEARKAQRVRKLRFEPFDVEHSTRCPAVGLRVGDGPETFFYAPDVAYIHDYDAALRSVTLYVGDGSSLTRSLVRKQGERLLGHAPMRQQLTWCAKNGVPHAIFTHCGKAIVTGDESDLARQLDALAAERDVSARLAYDGLNFEIPDDL